MVDALDVMRYLRPNGGWYISGNEYSGIKFISCESFSEEEFTSSFAKIETVKAEAEAKRQALLDRLGITADEARLLLG